MAALSLHPYFLVVVLGSHYHQYKRIAPVPFYLLLFFFFFLGAEPSFKLIAPVNPLLVPKNVFCHPAKKPTDLGNPELVTSFIVGFLPLSLLPNANAPSVGVTFALIFLPFIFLAPGLPNPGIEKLGMAGMNETVGGVGVAGPIPGVVGILTTGSANLTCCFCNCLDKVPVAGNWTDPVLPILPLIVLDIDTGAVKVLIVGCFTPETTPGKLIEVTFVSGLDLLVSLVSVTANPVIEGDEVISKDLTWVTNCDPVWVSVNKNGTFLTEGVVTFGCDINALVGIPFTSGTGFVWVISFNPPVTSPPFGVDIFGVD